MHRAQVSDGRVELQCAERPAKRRALVGCRMSDVVRVSALDLQLIVN